jgi:putative DNA primase/helicase
MPAPQLQLFTAPWVTRHLGLPLLTKLFARFTHLLPSKYTLPNTCLGEEYYECLASVLEQPGALPKPLIQALHEIEATAASLHRPGAVPDIDPDSNPENAAPARLRQAIELWLARAAASTQATQIPERISEDPRQPAAESQASETNKTARYDSLSPRERAGVRGNTTPEIASPSPVPQAPSDAADPDAATFARLARLSTPEYDRLRRSEAKRLHLRVATLDTEVARCRSQFTDDADANAVTLPTVDPWPDPVRDAPELLDQVADRYANYILLPTGAADALSLFTTHVPAYTAFYQTPRLNLYSPKRGCGKTTTLDVLATLVPRPFRADNIRPAVLFRVVDQQQPILLLDEVDTYLHQANELRGLLNAGHKRGACAYRCEGAGNAIRAFKAFAPAALAGIGALPPTLHDRSILIPLTEAQSGQIRARFDESRTDLEKTIARKLARWAKDNLAALAACDPVLPPGAFNRRADNWRPLFAIAQVVGGHWPQRALDAFAQLNPKTPAVQDAGLALLGDIRLIFAQSGADRLFSTSLVNSLRALPDRPWCQLQAANPPPAKLNEMRLARHLAAFDIYPRLLRINHRRGKGYELADFAPAFNRCLPHPDSSTG